MGNLDSDSIMALFRSFDRHYTEHKFALIPAVYDDENPFIQAACSIGDGRDSSVSEASTKRGISLREGDLISGLIDITNERAHMVPEIRNKDREGDKKELVRACVRPAGHLSNLTYPFLLGGVLPLPGNHPSRISGRVESGPPFQYNLV